MEGRPVSRFTYLTEAAVRCGKTDAKGGISRAIISPALQMNSGHSAEGTSRRGTCRHKIARRPLCTSPDHGAQHPERKHGNGRALMRL